MSRREPNRSASKLGRCPGPSFFLLRAVSRKTASWQQARSAPKTRKEEAASVGFARGPGPSFFLLRAVSIKKRPAGSKQGQPQNSQRRSSFSRFCRETHGEKRETTLEPASQHLASDRKEWETQEHDPAAGVTASGIRPQRLGDTGRRATQTSDKRETRSLWHPDTEKQAGDPVPSVTASGIRPQRLGDTWRRDWEHGRRAGDTTPELAASQHLASDRRDWDTGNRGRQAEPASQHQENKRKTRPRSQRHSIWHPTAKTDKTGIRHGVTASCL